MGLPGEGRGYRVRGYREMRGGASVGAGLRGGEGRVTGVRGGVTGMRGGVTWVRLHHSLLQNVQNIFVHLRTHKNKMFPTFPSGSVLNGRIGETSGNVGNIFVTESEK